MPRERTGSVYQRADGRWCVKITGPDGKRRSAVLPPGTPEAEARDAAATLARAVVEGRVVTIPQAAKEAKGERLEDWAGRWFDARERQGLEVDADRARFRKWTLDAEVRAGRVRLGDLPVAEVTREDLEDVVSALDDEVRAGEIAWKTAINAWGLTSKAFADAADAKDRTLRARNDNPAERVKGPERGARPAKAWLYPSEVDRVLACEGIALEVRRAIALNVYLYTRPGELRGLRWRDVGLEAGRVSVHRAIKRDGSTKGTKTKQPRSVPLEPAAATLLEAMRPAEADPDAPVVTLPPDTALADVLREAVREAEVTRPELFGSEATRKPITWYDLRATGITWRAIRGDNPIAIMRQAGHEDFKTTTRYIREAEAVGASFGQPFGPMPGSLLGGATATVVRLDDARDLRAASKRTGGFVSLNRLAVAKLSKSLWADRDSNPGPTD
jgi:integrase